MRCGRAGLLFVAVVLAAAEGIRGHGAVTFPPPRNAIDSNEAPWKNGVPRPVPFEPWCPFPQNESALSGANGQACFWFSNGCGIGCETPDGNTRGPIPNNPNFRQKANICGSPVKPTVCDPSLRTVNTDAKCGADDDWYETSPWRYPGSAGIFDSCGMAGGRTQPGGYGAVYTNTTNARQGDLGSKTLKPRPTGIAWQPGSIVQVAWAIQANHGGGYQYRLCPASEPLTEECFARTPLPFVGKQGFRWNGTGGPEFWFEGTYVSEGTVPEGSTWAMNPIPRNDTAQTGASFPPRCDEVPNCGSTATNSRCKCSGMWGPYNLEILDYVQIPAHLPAGDYVLGWRWDCEESNQVWASCSDIAIM